MHSIKMDDKVKVQSFTPPSPTAVGDIYRIEVIYTRNGEQCKEQVIIEADELERSCSLKELLKEKIKEMR